MANVIGNLINKIFNHDQHMWDNFNEEQKIAFCKIMQVLAKSDDVIQRVESQVLPDIPTSYFSFSKKISDDVAIAQLKTVSEKAKAIIIEELNQVANADDHLSSPEMNFISKVTLGIK
jgi:uncharacterized tellurite resistance protein B-like protein